MKHIIMLLVLIMINGRYKTWRRLPENLPTLIYVAFINLIYYFVSQKKKVWEFRSNDLSLKKVRFIQSFLATPLITLLYLSGVPYSLGKSKVMHFLLYTGVSTFFEWLANKKLKMISFYNGWNIQWSLLIYIQLFLFAHLYKKYPMIIWLMTILSIDQYVRLFSIPIQQEMFRPSEIKDFLENTYY
ncbi:hypothetical protein DS745_21280 [Anaerobacillus alkaliphilus]|uniref:Uncharacterized protein n=1 Tax=Anaerobacillus alkaliphilus TaxID=1548597 RepID=A0A4Q0VN54_9BACI|nr:CBO0543 family protein [Anaerobacillus alkaliphilus]RXI96270.1 hypothetical protein DS745_21280 [Anaerobacillus alkaliphilus]